MMDRSSATPLKLYSNLTADIEFLAYRQITDFAPWDFGGRPWLSSGRFGALIRGWSEGIQTRAGQDTT